MGIRSFLPGRLGFGSAPLGNMYRAIPEEEALATVEAAWDHGVRYFDTAPFYGAGLSELRLGRVLGSRPRQEYTLSTKVGRIILDEVEDPATRDLGDMGGLFEHGRPNKIVYDYGAEQFSLAHPAVVAVVPGSSRPERVAEDLAALDEHVPAAFWTALCEEKLIAPDAPVPTS